MKTKMKYAVGAANMSISLNKGFITIKNEYGETIERFEGDAKSWEMIWDTIKLLRDHS